MKSARVAVWLALAGPFLGLAIAADAVDADALPPDPPCFRAGPPTDLNPADRPAAPVTQILPRPGVTGDKAGPRDQALERLNRVVDGEKAMPLQQGTQSRVYIQPGASRGTIVMYHGFTAGSWQFELLARRAYADGFNVYVPRLPGHGLKNPTTGREDPSGLLTARNWRDYETFAGSTYQDIKGLGSPIYAIGLSVGGGVALSVAESHPDIARVVAYAPFLQAAGLAGDVLRADHVADTLTFGLAGKALRYIPFSWGRGVEKETVSGERPGHAIFNLGTLYAATLNGRDILKNASQLKAPVQFFASAIDEAADLGTIRKMYGLLGGGPKNGWYFYPKEEKVPHAMIHPYEDRGAGQTPALYDNTMRFLETGQLINRP